MDTNGVMKRVSLVSNFFLLSSLLVGCAGETPTEPPTMIPSRTPSPTVTDIPASPTASITPSPTITPTPRPLSRLDPTEFPCIDFVCPSSTSLTALHAILGDSVVITVDGQDVDVDAPWIYEGINFSIRDDVIVQTWIFMPRSEEMEFANMLSVLGTPTEIWFQFREDPMAIDQIITQVEMLVLWYPKGVLAQYEFNVDSFTQSEVRYRIDKIFFSNFWLWSIADEEPPPIYYWLEERLSEYYVFGYFSESDVEEFTEQVIQGNNFFILHRSVLFDD